MLITFGVLPLPSSPPSLVMILSLAGAGGDDDDGAGGDSVVVDLFIVRLEVDLLGATVTTGGGKIRS